MDDSGNPDRKRDQRIRNLLEMVAQRFCERRAANWNERENCGHCPPCEAKWLLMEESNNEDPEVQ